ncbi:molybdopterin-dependent oxidoreductase [Nocardioides sp.]|uniref:molybdopterin-dependent oxidoreductase n=1 Tax=Nocardioides sp. TaxID=35761 RepID=UPI00271F2925|nr:molybdopterin-dependent oxidoreductase [Nocardioides sp.]MDO9455135.1 molybdopterin-dependent oxidoreductase [Nocardioides sp.]
MKRSAVGWWFAGVLAGFTGLAVNYALTEWFNQPGAVIAVADFVRDHSPAGIVNWARENSGKKITVPAILLILVLVFALIGRLARDRWWVAVAGYGAVGVLGGAAVLTTNGATVARLVPVAVGYVAMVGALSLLGERLGRLQALDDQQVFGELWRGRRRDFLVVVGAVFGVAGISGIAGRVLGGDVRKQKEEQKSLRLPVTAPVVPSGVRVDVDGVQPWMTPADEFYLIDTAFSRPVVLAEDWSLRIHGMVDREIVIDYNDLIARDGVEAWITLNCVSNEVGGDLIGNAWWSGTLLAPLLREAGIQDGADAVLQTSDDGWTCGTPLTEIMDGRQAMLAVAMNGEPLPRDHGYPVRTIIPGLYGYVSGTKWVVDMEVTTFDQIDAYWTQRGWGELGPVKIASKVEVPSSGDEVSAGEVVVAGTAWIQHTGISAVDIQVDGGPWTSTDLGRAASTDTWVQWKATVELEAGDHTVTVRATDAQGNVQTSVRADVLPDGATGWHSVDFTAT